jgi:hypothetical protein
MPIYLVDVEEKLERVIDGAVFQREFVRGKWTRFKVVEVNVPRGADPESSAKTAIKRGNQRAQKSSRGGWYTIKMFLSIKGLGEGEGRDRYGKFYRFTGKEAKGHCFWCGKKLMARQVRYCSEQHKENYLRQFHWIEASWWCWEDWNHTCGVCGAEKQYKVIQGYDLTRCVPVGKLVLEVHHIDPMGGKDRNWSIKNRPENLILLCHDCHVRVHNGSLDLIAFLGD